MSMLSKETWRKHLPHSTPTRHKIKVDAFLGVVEKTHDAALLNGVLKAIRASKPGCRLCEFYFFSGEVQQESCISKARSPVPMYNERFVPWAKAESCGQHMILSARTETSSSHIR